MNKENNTTYNIRISSSNDRRSVSFYDKVLTDAGFVYEKRKTETASFYELNDASALDCEIWGDWAKRNGFKCHKVEMYYTRSDDYRQDYFKNNKPIVEAKYRCVYCGRKFPYRKITVDHLYPINKLMYEQTTRDRAKLSGINGANDVQNLVAACRFCNTKKGTKMGLWILRGKIGRHEWFWKLRNMIVTGLVLFFVYNVYLKPMSDYLFR